MSDRADWLEWRRAGIGGSDAAAVCGLDPWRNPTMVWLDKLGLIEAEEHEAMRWGTLLEPVIADEFERRTGYRVAERQSWRERPGTPWQRATLDGLVVLDGEDLGTYEGKTTSAMMHGQHWPDGVPEWVQLQCQHELAVTGLPQAWVTVLVGGQRLLWYELQRDDELIATLTAIEAEFWELVQAKVPPVVDSSEATNRALREAFAEPVSGASVELPREVLDVLRLRQRAKAEQKAAEERARQAESLLATMLREAEVGLVDGAEVVRWPVVERRQFDLDAFKAKFPRAAERFMTTTTYRRFWTPKESLDAEG